MRGAVLVCVTWTLLGLARADAGLDATALQQQRVTAAEAAERRAEPRQAAALYREAIALAPTARLARRAEQRLAWLEARAGDDWVALGELLRAQALPRAEFTPARVAALETRAAELAPGLARRELLALIALGWHDRLARPREAVAAYRRWLAEPGLDAGERERATRGLAAALGAAGQGAAGLRVLDEAGLAGESEGDMLRLAARRRVGRGVAWVALGLFAALALGLGWRGLALESLRRLRVWHLALAAWALVVPGVVAARYDAAVSDTFLMLALAAAGLLALAALAGVGLSRARAGRLRIGVVAVSAGLAQLAVGYLTLDRAGILLSFGL